MSYLLKGEDKTVCDLCKSLLSTKHILVENPFLNYTRQRFNSENILMDIFKVFS